MGSTQGSHSLPAAPQSNGPQSSNPTTPAPAQPPSAPPPGAAGGLPGTGGTDGFGGFGQTFLKEPVGRGQANTPDDVHQASAFLHANGILPAPTRDADEGFLRGVEKGQEKLNALAGGGLQIDGIAKPWGPTEILSQRAVSSGRMNPPRPAGPGASTADQVASAKRAATSKASAPNRPQLPPPHTNLPPSPGAPHPNLTVDTPNDLLQRARKMPRQAPGLKAKNVRRLPNGGIEADLPIAISQPASGGEKRKPGSRELRPDDIDAIKTFLINLGDNAALVLDYFKKFGLPSAFTSTLENPMQHLIKDEDKRT